MSYKISQWSEQDFSQARELWNGLLAQSDADPLFMSWEWQNSWWHLFADKLKLKSLILGITDESGNLLGIAPLFTTQVIQKGILKTKRIEFIGNCWRTHITMRTEKIDFIFRKELHLELINTTMDWLYKNIDFDEFIISDLLKSSPTFEYISAHDRYRATESYTSYYLDTSGDFAEYLKDRGKNTRLQVYNRRQKLESSHDVEIRYLNSNIDDNFDILNKLHKARWGKPVFQNDRLAFNKRVAKLLAEKQELHFILMLVDGHPESIQYNYRVRKREYNIQAGFNPAFANKIPLGYLMFGYAIENAFSSGMIEYDFLAGEGKNSDYKARLTNNTQSVIELQIFRKPRRYWLYKLYDFISK